MISDTLEEVRRRARLSLIPPERLALSEWIEQEVRLPSSVASDPGRIRLYPFQRGIADAMGDPKIERVTVVKSTRIGYTTLLIGVIGNFVVNDPAPILFVTPTEDMSRQFVADNLEPTVEDTPALAHVLAKPDKESRNRMLSRRFPGGSLNIVAAKSPRNLRGHNTRILIMDEVDGMEITREGPPTEIAERRTTSFADRKIIKGSTPVFAETSAILNEYARSDKRVYEVPCPECGDFHEIEWKDIRWPEGEPEKAHWCCPSCGSIVEERFKAKMVAGGRWRATAPHVKGHAGFKVNALISPLPNASWGKLAETFLAVKDDPPRLQTFINLELGEGWREHGEEIDDTQLAGRAERFDLDMLPEEVLAITAGVDVQDDRLEVTLIGWDQAGAAFILGHHVVWGLSTDDATWLELDEVLKWTFPHPFGGKLGIEAAAIDSSDGDSMETVYRFVFPRAARRIFAIKGVSGNRPFIERSKSKVKGGWLWIVGVDSIKTHIVSRLARPGSIRFSDKLDPVWFEQLVAERVVVRYSRGQPFRRFERIPGRRAEALDCVVYAFAVQRLLTINWSSREEQLRSPDLARPLAARPRTIPSSWMER